MTALPARIVDAHVHLWDPARSDWYPYLARPQDHVSGETSRMSRRFDVEIYRAETDGWNVEKFINVAAATGRNSVDETLELDRNGGPAAIIGGLPPTDTPKEAIELIEKQMAASRFRGVRPMGGLDTPIPDPEVLRALGERNLVFELMTHPDRLVESATQLAGFEDLTVVVEHTGWPRSNSGEERSLWEAGIDALARLDNVACKLSGLTMSLASMSADAQGPWLQYAIDAFGVDRCVFASNFPVDSVYGSFGDLYTTFNAVTADLDSGSRAKLFAENAERIYRC
jgi:L-fuconolactonase